MVDLSVEVFCTASSAAMGLELKSICNPLNILCLWPTYEAIEQFSVEFP